MPTISGIELAIHLRSQYAGTPIILITGYPEDSIEEKAAAVGIRHILLKPHLEENWSAVFGARLKKGCRPGR